jgi:hypothetical protein
METPAFRHGEEMPPPSFGLVSIFTLTPFSKLYNIGKALHLVEKRLAVPYQLRIKGCRE